MSEAKLERRLGLREATALNMIDMVGMGPFIVVPEVISAMHGPQAILAWVAGALLAFIDGFVWSELGAAMPEAGGSYVFLKELYGAKKLGKLISFLFIWQTVIQAPLVLASGAIGFGNYASYFYDLGPIGQKAVSGSLIIVLTILLYRKIETIGRISVMLWVGVILTILFIIFSGAAHFQPSLAFNYGPNAFELSPLFFAGLGAASVKTVYSYLGYYNVCHLGGEITEPERNIPRSIFISIAGIAVLYLTMQLSVLGVVPWELAAKSKYVYSVFMEMIYGRNVAMIVTGLILWVGFSSLFAALLGYSRIPYAAAKDGAFFKAFARVHPTKHFPHVSLLVLGTVAFAFSLLFRLGDVITAILAMRILVQFVGQAIGVILVRRTQPNRRWPYTMWGFPLPALLAIVIWAWLFTATGATFMLAGIGVMTLGLIVYLVRAKLIGLWPFNDEISPEARNATA